MGTERVSTRRSEPLTPLERPTLLWLVCSSAKRRLHTCHAASAGFGAAPQGVLKSLSGAFLCRLMDHLKQICLGFLHVLRCRQIRLLRGLVLQKRQRLSELEGH